MHLIVIEICHRWARAVVLDLASTVGRAEVGAAHDWIKSRWADCVIRGMMAAQLSAPRQSDGSFFQPRGESLGFEKTPNDQALGDGEARGGPDLQKREIDQELTCRAHYFVNALHPAGLF